MSFSLLVSPFTGTSNTAYVCCLGSVGILSPQRYFTHLEFCLSNPEHPRFHLEFWLFTTVLVWRAESFRFLIPQKYLKRTKPTKSSEPTDHSGDDGLMILHEALLVLLGPLKQRVHHGLAQAGLCLLLHLGDNLLLRQWGSVAVELGGVRKS